jgi:hypothetical protein
MPSGNACWIWSKGGCSWETSRRPVATAAAGRVCRKRGSALGDHTDENARRRFLTTPWRSTDASLTRAGDIRLPRRSQASARVQDAISRFSCQTPIRKMKLMSPSIDARMRYHRRRSTMTKTPAADYLSARPLEGCWPAGRGSWYLRFFSAGWARMPAIIRSVSRRLPVSR